MKEAKCQDKTLIEYTDLYHDLFNELEPDRQRVYDDIIHWILNHVDGGNRPISSSPAPRLAKDDAAPAPQPSHAEAATSAAVAASAVAPVTTFSAAPITTFSAEPAASPAAVPNKDNTAPSTTVVTEV